MANKTVKKSKKAMFINALKIVGGMLPVEAEEVRSAIDFTVESFNANPRDVTVADIKETCQLVEANTGKTMKEWGEMYKATIQKEEPVLVENSEKVKIKPKAKKEEVDEEEKPEVIEEKVISKKVEKMTLVSSFPDELQSKALGDNITLKIRRDIKTATELSELIKENVDLIIAVYWNKRQLKQFKSGYDPINVNPDGIPVSFEHDLDIIEITFSHELVVTGNSIVTVVPYTFLGAEFEQDEDGIRYANGMEFQIYEVIETVQEA